MLIMTATTDRKDLRSRINGFDVEDTSLVESKEIWDCQRPNQTKYTYNTILHALADNWKLLGSPQFNNDMHKAYFWWLTKD